MEYLVTFAAAYAESGDFDKAKFWEAKAIEMDDNRQVGKGERQG